MNRRLCLLGGESAGKTTLARELVRRLPGSVWVPEYGRELWERIGGVFSPALLLEVARAQAQREDEAERLHPGWVVCDTTALTTLVYCLIDHGHAPAELHALAQRPYTLTVMCELDFGFVQDGARRDSAFSQRQQALAESLLRDMGRPWVSVRGSPAQRAEQVLQVLQGLETAQAPVRSPPR